MSDMFSEYPPSHGRRYQLTIDNEYLLEMEMTSHKQIKRFERYSNIYHNNTYIIICYENIKCLKFRNIFGTKSFCQKFPISENFQTEKCSLHISSSLVIIELQTEFQFPKTFP